MRAKERARSRLCLPFLRLELLIEIALVRINGVLHTKSRYIVKDTPTD